MFNAQGNEMTTKRHPFTPLPWQFVESVSGSCIDAKDYRVTSMEKHEGTRVDQEYRENIAFAVHAANAYPELIACLRSMGTDDIANHHAIKALFDKLGEEM